MRFDRRFDGRVNGRFDGRFDGRVNGRFDGRFLYHDARVARESRVQQQHRLSEAERWRSWTSRHRGGHFESRHAHARAMAMPSAMPRWSRYRASVPNTLPVKVVYSSSTACRKLRLCRDVCTGMCAGMFTDVCTDMCIDMCTDMCVDPR